MSSSARNVQFQAVQGQGGTGEMKTSNYEQWSRDELQTAADLRSAQVQDASAADDLAGVAQANAAYHAIKLELACRNCRALAESDAPLTNRDRAAKTMLYFVEQAAYWESLALGVQEGRAA